MKNTQVLQISDDAIRQAADIIRGGGLVAFPTETVYGLGANALDAEAVARIFEAKARPLTDPVIVHIADIADLEKVAINLPDLVPTLAAALMPGALTLVLKRSGAVPAIVSAGGDTVAVRMPAHPVARALIRAADVPIAAPSANTFSRPSATTAAHVVQDLNGKIDLILDGGAATIGVESTILDLTVDPPRILRPGGIPVEAIRAFVPNVEVVERYLDTDTAASSPGQMLKHYSPRARVSLFTGSPDKSLLRMQNAIAIAVGDSEQVGVLISDEPESFVDGLQMGNVAFVEMGQSLEEVSANLFAALRALDAQSVNKIFVLWTRRDGLGAAIWDRLVRAAEGRVITYL